MGKVVYQRFGLAMPTDPDLVMALGQLAIAHTQLELVLRYHQDPLWPASS